MISSEQQNQIRDLLQVPDLSVFVETLWGSHNPGYRELLKDFRQKQNSQYCSLSHTYGTGVLICSQQSPLGVDVEVAARVSLPIIKRVSSDLEAEEAPYPAALWCAKEACFKALKSYQQPSVVSSVSIGDWKNIDSHTETFRLINFGEFLAPSAGRGLIIQSADFCFGFFAFST